MNAVSKATEGFVQQAFGKKAGSVLKWSFVFRIKLSAGRQFLCFEIRFFAKRQNVSGYITNDRAKQKVYIFADTKINLRQNVKNNFFQTYQNNNRKAVAVLFNL